VVYHNTAGTCNASTAGVVVHFALGIGSVKGNRGAVVAERGIILWLPTQKVLRQPRLGSG